MKAAAKRIRDRAKREGNPKDADISSGWRIDLKVMNKVKRIVEKEGEEDTRYPVKGKKETKKKKKGVKEKVPKKRKRGGQKKAFHLPLVIPLQLTSSCIFQSQKKAKPSMPSSGTGASSLSDTDTEESESDSSDTSDVQTVAELQKQNHCAQCSAPCVLLTTSHHHRLTVDDLSLWATMIVWPLFRFNEDHHF